MLYKIGFSLEPAREVEIFLGFAFQASESMLHILTIQSFQEFMAIDLHAKKKILRCLVLIRVFYVEYIGTVGARSSFRALLSHVTINFSPLQVTSLRVQKQI